MNMSKRMLRIAVSLLLVVLCGARARGAEPPAAIVRTDHAMTVDGKLDDWEGITADHEVSNLQGETVATFRLAFDEDRLYAAFAVRDGSPLRNGSTVMEELLKGGDAVGLCLGPAGERGAHQRILAARVKGKAVVMAYRPEWPEKRPHTFASPVRELEMDYVGPVDGAKVAFRATESGYRAELSLPWKSLGLGGKLPGSIPFDAQVIFSNPAGTVNESAAWWHTAGGAGFTTEDLPTEADLYPEEWGTARLFEEDPGPREAGRKIVEEVGTPIEFDLPRDARVSMIITDREGWIVRELLRAKPMSAGKHTVHWDGRDRYDEALPPGRYTWRLAWFDGMGTEFHGSVGNSARPPFRTADGRGSMGGQHGGPSVIAADAGGIYIAGGAEEGHPAMRKIDRRGYTLWKRSMGGFGSAMALATDDEHAYLVHSPGRGSAGMALLRLDPKTGREVPLGGERRRIRIADKRKRIGGLAIVGERAYVSFPDEDRIVVADLGSASLGGESEMDRPLGLARGAGGRLLVCSGDSIKAVEPAGGDVSTVVDGLEEPHGLAVDGQGRIYVSELGESQRIRIFDGAEQVGVIGVKGGRPETTLDYDPRAMRAVHALAVDAGGDVWAVERSGLRRVARYGRDGECELELFGPVAYNVFGPDLDDFSRVYFQPSRGGHGTLYAEAWLDYAAYGADPAGGATAAWGLEAVFDLEQEAGPDGTDLMSGPMKAGYGHVVAFTGKNGHRYLWRIAKSNRATNPSGAAIWRWKAGRGWIPAAFVSNRKGLSSWSDADGDGRVQAEERYGPPPTNRFAWLDRDLTLYGWSGTLEPSRIDARGVPSYDGGLYEPYLDEGASHPAVMNETWVFNSMPDSEGAIYYAANYGTHRHRTTWDRASENAIVKVQDGRVRWMIGKNDPYMRTPGAMNTVTGIAGVVDDILIAHIVEPANYIAYTTDGFTLGNVIVDEAGRRPSVGPNAIYIESFTGLFLRDPESRKRLLFAVSSGDDRILEVTGPGEITRREGRIDLRSSYPRERAPRGQAVIPYETWYGNRSRGYGIDGKDWEWQPGSRGLSISEDGAILGDVRMRRDAGALYVLAAVLDRPGERPEVEVAEPGELWGRVEGLELMLGPARLLGGREPLPGDTRLFLGVHEGKGVALYRRAGDSTWRPLPGAAVGRQRRWNDYGWRLEARIPFTALPEITRRRTQTFRRSAPGDTMIKVHKEKRLDMPDPIRLNAAFHLHDGQSLRRVPWVEDGTRLDAPGRMHPARWGFANLMVELSWSRMRGVREFTLYRAPRDGTGAVSRVAERVRGTEFVDTPGPEDFLYWIAPETAEGTGQPCGPVPSRESAASFPPCRPVPPHPFDAIGDLVLRRPFRIGLMTVRVEAKELAAEAPEGVTVETSRQSAGTWLVAVRAPAQGRPGDVYEIGLRAEGPDGPTVESRFDAVVGVDMMASLPPGSMSAPGDSETGWVRDPATDADGNPRHKVRVSEEDGVPAPCIEMEAWNTNNTITHPLNRRPVGEYWRAEGHFRLIARHGTTTVGVRVLDGDGRPIADFHFGRRKFDGEWARYLALQDEYVIHDSARYNALAADWQPFTIRAEDGRVRIAYGRGEQRHVVEKPPRPGSDWEKPAQFQVYLGGRTSGRKIRVDNLEFVGK